MSIKNKDTGLLMMESVISYILIVGVIISVVLEITGLVFFYRTYNNFDFSESGLFKIQGHDFFGYIL